MKLTDYQQIIDGQLKHRNFSYEDLAAEYQTPLYLFDEDHFKEKVTAYREAFKHPELETQILYASKALLTKAVGRLIAELEIGQDVVSAGEIYAGLESGIPARQMYFHGNNKLKDELAYALDKRVGIIVIDNRQEAKRLQKLAEAKNVQQKVLLRVNPGVEAHTHEYIKTAHNDSKFGESVADSSLFDVLDQIIDYPNLEFRGFHSHIGSQIFEEESFVKAADELMHFAANVQKQLGYPIREINFGGGFGVYYTKGDQPFKLEEFLPTFTKHVAQKAKDLEIRLEKICIEPGRSLVNDCGSTLYRVGDTKETLSGKQYAFVDGSMNDNIRPALYQADYEAANVLKMDQEADTTYTIAGKACESGDKIIESIELPQTETGDLILVNGTGAYNHSMASNYNRIPIPAMIHLGEKGHRLTVRRQSFEDMMAQDVD